MDDKLFEELVQSVREMGAIIRGETKPTRVKELSLPLKHSFDNREEAQKRTKEKQETA